MRSAHWRLLVNMPWLWLPQLKNIQIQRGVGTSTNGAANFSAQSTQTSKRIPAGRGLCRNRSGFGSFQYLFRISRWKAGQDFTSIIALRWMHASPKSLQDATLATSETLFLRFEKAVFVSAGYYGERCGEYIIQWYVFRSKSQTYQKLEMVSLNRIENKRTDNFYTYDNWNWHYQQDPLIS